MVGVLRFDDREPRGESTMYFLPDPTVGRIKTPQILASWLIGSSRSQNRREQVRFSVDASKVRRSQALMVIHRKVGVITIRQGEQFDCLRHGFRAHDRLTK